jgi:hypothetical protein
VDAGFDQPVFAFEHSFPGAGDALVGVDQHEQTIFGTQRHQQRLQDR